MRIIRSTDCSQFTSAAGGDKPTNSALINARCSHMRIIRIFFTKLGEAAYISHLDLQRVFSRAVRQSGLPVWYSQGFNPHIYMSFALPLPLGCESVCECVDMKTEADDEDFTKFVKPLCNALPKGIDVTSISTPVHEGKDITKACYSFAWPERDSVEFAIDGYNATEEIMVLRKTKRSQQMVNLKDVLPTLKLEGERQNEFNAVLPAGDKLNYNPKLLLGFLQETFGLSANEAVVTRRRIFVDDETIFC